jgi:hypothetical protein
MEGNDNLKLDCTRKPVVWITLGVFAVALVLNLGLALKLGIGKPLVSDAAYFRELAVNLASGRGYVVDESFWPGQPTMRRLPGWPFVASLAIRVCPGAPPDAVMRVLAVMMNALTAGLLCLMAVLAFRRLLAGALTGLAFAIHPTALHAANQGLSEPLFLALVAGGVCLLLLPRRWFRVGGAFVLGCSCLVRTNFVLWIGFVGVLFALRVLRTRAHVTRQDLATVAACAALFALPPMAWAARNYTLCHHFPVFSTLRGQTFYGGNNEVVANTLEHWGYWIFPNLVPGESPMGALADTMTEYEVDLYYYEKGKAYVRANGSAMPRLWLGKLVRAYIPIPWKPSWGSYAVSAYRWFLYLCAAWGVGTAWRRADPIYPIAVSAMLLTSVATVVLFWGCARFAFAVEPFLLPFAAAAAVEKGRQLLAR